MMQMRYSQHKSVTRIRNIELQPLTLTINSNIATCKRRAISSDTEGAITSLVWTIEVEAHARRRSEHVMGSGRGHDVVVVPVAGAARVEVRGERDVDGGHGGDRRCEDRHAHLAPEGGATEAPGGGRGGGGELGISGLGECHEEALGARADAGGGMKLGHDEVDLLRQRRVAVSSGVSGCCGDLGIHKQKLAGIFLKFPLITQKRTKTED